MNRYRISELADRVGVPATTLRYYERQGLLPAARTGAGYRTYDDHDVERMQFIATAKTLGLPLDRIRDSLTAAVARLDALPSRDTPCDPACLFPTGPPTACTLTGEDYDRRAAQWRDVLGGAHSRWTGDTAVRVSLGVDRLPAVAALITEESRCCPFLTFRLAVSGDGVQLDIAAPADAGPVLRALVDDAASAWSAC